MHLDLQDARRARDRFLYPLLSQAYDSTNRFREVDLLTVRAVFRHALGSAHFSELLTSVYGGSERKYCCFFVPQHDLKLDSTSAPLLVPLTRCLAFVTSIGNLRLIVSRFCLPTKLRRAPDVEPKHLFHWLLLHEAAHTLEIGVEYEMLPYIREDHDGRDYARSLRENACDEWADLQLSRFLATERRLLCPAVAERASH